MIRFHDPEWFWLLTVLPLVIWHYARTRGGGALSFSSLKNIKRIRHSGSYYARHILLFLRIGGIVLLVCALARPQKGKEDTKITTEGINIVMTVDTSGSMIAEDLLPGKNRLDVAKVVMQEFIKKRSHDRIGLVVYGEDAYTQCPLTLDYGVLLDFLKHTEIGMAGKNSTSIGDALATSVMRLDDVESKSKVVILLTDGRNNSGIVSPEDAAEMARTLGVKVYTIGAGTIGNAPVPTRDFFGKKIYVQQRVDIDEKLLKHIANITSGKYFRATNEKSLESIYDDINRMEKTKTEVFHYMEYRELFTYYCLSGAALLLLETLLAHTRFRKLP